MGNRNKSSCPIINKRKYTIHEWPPRQKMYRCNCCNAIIESYKRSYLELWSIVYLYAIIFTRSQLTQVVIMKCTTVTNTSRISSPYACTDIITCFEVNGKREPVAREVRRKREIIWPQKLHASNASVCNWGRARAFVFLTLCARLCFMKFLYNCEVYVRRRDSITACWGYGIYMHVCKLCLYNIIYCTKQLQRRVYKCFKKM